VAPAAKVGGCGIGCDVGEVWGAHSLLSAAPELFEVRGGGDGELSKRVR
jgi:hypothetical protein